VAVFIMTRSGRTGFAEKEFSALKVIQPHLANFYHLSCRALPRIDVDTGMVRLTSREKEIAVRG
jgi:hypothetical protein